MLATLVIGLREGLEASLIVGIIAAFLRRTGKPLRPMWIGVAIAIALSIAVGIILELVSAELPQSQQEAMESIIGLVAVGVVTGMIGWMNTHARNMKKELEAHAASALRDGTAWALVGMAFLAVLKEGFETSVFLLAAFQSSTSSLAAGAGAVVGIGISVAIGIGIFRGGVKLNLAKFFRITGLFLVFVAAGLVLSSLRTAHEAGWITIGQQSTINLSWLAPAGSVQSALLTGVLGIPSDPRLIEVLGWFAYLIPVLAYLLWPVAKRPSTAALPRLRFGIAASLGAVAVILALAIPLPGTHAEATAPLAGGGTARLTSSDGQPAVATTSPASKTVFGATTTTVHDGVTAQLGTSTRQISVADKPTSISLGDLITLNGGRLPIGVAAGANPGPFDAKWTSTVTTSAWTVGSSLLDARAASRTLVTLSGGGLASTRTISPSTSDAASWSVKAGHARTVAAGIASAASSRSELLLWKLWLPLALALTALVLCAYALKSRFTLKRRAAPPVSAPVLPSRVEPAPARG